MNLSDAHKEIEVIFNVGVDHIHADMLHRFIDEQEEEIDRLKALLVIKSPHPD